MAADRPAVLAGCAPVEFRPPTRADADTITALLVACDIADFGAPDYDRDALLEEWADPAVDLPRDGFLGDGAYALLAGGYGRAWVHPARRGQGLGAALAERLEARARERGLAQLLQQVPRSVPRARALLEGRGYQLVRSYAEVRLPDTGVAALPPGDAVRPYDDARDEAAVQALMEAALGAGAGRLEPLDVLLARNPDTSLWRVADAPDGAGVAGALRCELRAAGLIVGYVSQVAVAEAHRRQGIGRALVAAAARELVDRGAAGIRAHVRSNNPRALAFFERLGFTPEWVADELGLALD